MITILAWRAVSGKKYLCMGLFDGILRAIKRLRSGVILPGGNLEISADYVFRNAYFVAGIEAIIRGLQRLRVEVVNERGEPVRTFLDGLQFNDILRAIVYDLYTHGNAFVYIVRVGSEVKSIVSLPVSAVSLEVDGVDVRYRVGNATYPADDILHFKRFIPDENDFHRTIRGDSPTKGVEDMLKLNYLINASLVHNFRRNNLPSIAIINRQMLPSQEVQRFIENMEQKLQSNYSFLYLQGETELRELQARYPDWTLTVKDKVRDEILAVLGVPRLLVGDTDSVNYANARQQYQVFYTETIIPLARLIESEFNLKVFSRQGLTMRFRTDAVEVLQTDIRDKIQAMMMLWNMGYPIDQLAEIFNLPKPLRTREENNTANIVVKTTRDYTDIQTRAFSFRRRTDREFHNIITKNIAESIKAFDVAMMDDVFRVLRQEMSLSEFEQRLDAFFAERSNNLAADVKAFYTRSFFDFIRQVHNRHIQKDYWAFLVENIIDNHAKKIKRVNETVKRQVRNSIVVLLNDYGKVMDLSDDLKENIKVEVIRPFKNQRARATTIARTELTSVLEDVNFTYHEAAGFEYKVWVTALDEAVRPSHGAIHGARAWIGEVFPNGLMYPGDPNAVDASEVVNCRCTLIYEP